MGTVCIGTAGWSYDDWVGPVYPHRASSRWHPLPFLAQFVEAVEINSSFYALPSAAHAERWLGHVRDRPGLRFASKLYRGFTHEASRVHWADDALRFSEGIAPLSASPRWYGLLAQFSARRRESAAMWRHLDRIRALFPDVPLFVELRHRSFFTPAALTRLASLGLSLVHIDLPHHEDHPPGDLPSLGTQAWVRIHGRNAEAWFRRAAHRDEVYNYLYPPAEIDELETSLRKIKSAHDETLVITNNHYGGKAVLLALQLRGRLKGTPVSAPASLIEAYGAHPELTVSGQQTLF